MVGVGVAGFAFALQTPTKVDFARDVQPILRARCESCHKGKSPAGGLDVSSYELIAKSGTVIAFKSAESRLMVRIRTNIGSGRMPLGFAPLSDKDAATVAAWIDAGAKPPAAKKAHWAYVAPKRPELPVVKDRAWVRNPIDAFVLARLEHEKLQPSPDADRTTLIRRLSLDLIGLPPTPAEVDAFVVDKSPNAYEKVVDRLFANPHYGERMALPWLDAARYADSNGFQQDGDTFQWVWRDWLVRALNANEPFDQFTTEQLAGDLLPNPSTDQIVATAFNRNHMLNGEGGAIAEEQRNIVLFDRVDTTSTTWLGLTMTCARCHDHKYDPLSQRDYYSMMAFFNNVPESGVPSGSVPYYLAEPTIPVPSPMQAETLKGLESEIAASKAQVVRAKQSDEYAKAFAKWVDQTKADTQAPAALRKLVNSSSLADLKKAFETFETQGAEGELKETFGRQRALESQMTALRTSLPKVMVMSDRQPRKTHVYTRGNYETPAEEVTAATPLTLTKPSAAPPVNRLGLAKWIVSADNPLTARVQVNRYWQLFFGRGLVKTPENFGVQSEPPTHPELLDWLAVDFRESGWNVKRLQRLIVTSATYRQSSKVSKSLLARDADNRFFARGARFRLSSLLLRDVALASSGLLNAEIGGKPVYPYQPENIWGGLAITDERDFAYPQSKGADLFRRSIYTFWRRTVGPGNMFDASSRQVCTVRPSSTSTPLHALTMMNDVTWVEAGRVLGEQAIAKRVSAQDRLKFAFRQVCARNPSPSELAILGRGLERARRAFAADPRAAAVYLKQGATPPNAKIDPVEDAAFATVCAAIYNLDEALSRE